MIPKKNNQDIDLNAQIDKDLAKAQEQQKEKINKNIPKLAQVVGGKIKYVIIIFFSGIIFYKIVFAPKPAEISKKKQSTKNKIVKSNNSSTDQQRFADKTVSKLSKGSISDEKINGKKIVSLDMQVLSNTEAINNVQVPKLNIPTTPTLPMIDKITIKDEQTIENGKDQQLNEKKKNDDKNNEKQKDKTSKLFKKKIKKRIKDENGRTKIVSVIAEVDQDGNIVKEDINKSDTESSIDIPLSEQLTSEAERRENNKLKSIDNSGGTKSLDEMFVLSGKGMNSVKRQNLSGSKDDFILPDGSNIIEQEIVIDQESNISKIKKPENTLVAGKIIDATLETSINSSSPGVIKAVVSQDVFGATGTKILIPAGSHLFGTCLPAATTTQTRAFLTWTRIVRPDGIIISINSDTHDKTGKKGIEGDINTRYGEVLKNSLLYSIVTIASVAAAQKIAGIRNSTSVITGNGASVMNTSPANIAATSVLETTRDIIDKMTTDLTKDLKPIFTIPHGVQLKVIINTDIVISPAYHRRKQSIEVN